MVPQSPKCMARFARAFTNSQYRAVTIAETYWKKCWISILQRDQAQLNASSTRGLMKWRQKTQAIWIKTPNCYSRSSITWSNSKASPSSAARLSTFSWRCASQRNTIEFQANLNQSTRTVLVLLKSTSSAKSSQTQTSARYYRRKRLKTSSSRLTTTTTEKSTTQSSSPPPSTLGSI
jgi:hypothetical protein